jgi:tetratricopeptide (TPR) repeat protein
LQEGIAECEQALALDRNWAHAPRAHLWMMFVGGAKLHLGAAAEALTWFRRGLKANPNNSIAHFHYAAASAHLGRLNEARAATQAGLALDPAFTLRRSHANVLSDNPTYLGGARRIYEGMRMAGVPEG